MDQRADTADRASTSPIVVVGGEALIDLVIDPRGGVIAKQGGGPFNTARTIARLGINSRFVGSMSDDRFGTLMQAQLRVDGVDTSLLRHSTRPTTLAAAEIDEGGAAQYRFYFEGTSAPDFPLYERPTLTAIDAFHIGTLGLVFEPMATTYEAMLSEIDPEVLVVLDPNCRPRANGERPADQERVARVLRRAHG
ncbi:MAG: PfkB family carbohydrate kinase, partial [Acidimicrobiia bacterium]